MDLFDNPMVNAARKALTPEQIEEYKKIGEYMYNNFEYKTVGMQNVKEHADLEELIVYANEMLKAGGDPKDLSEAEVKALRSGYGEFWWKNYGFKKDPRPSADIKVPDKIDVSTLTDEDYQKMKTQIKENKVPRKARRIMEKKMDKERAKNRKKKYNVEE